MAMRIAVSDMLRRKPFSVCAAVAPTAPAPIAVPHALQPATAAPRARRAARRRSRARRQVMKDRSSAAGTTVRAARQIAPSLLRQHYVGLPGVFQVARDRQSVVAGKRVLVRVERG